MRNVFLSIISIFFALFLILPGSVVAQTQNEQIQLYNTQIAIQADGKIQVVEDITYDFGGQSRHGIFRNIPYLKTNKEGKKFTMDVQVASVTDETGKPYNYTVTDENHEQKIKIGDANILVTGVKEYVITYTVSGALTYFSDHDELYWNAVGTEWNVPVTHSITTITLPSDVAPDSLKQQCYTGVAGSPLTNCQMSIQDKKMQFETEELGINNAFTVVAGFPKNITAVLEPTEYKDFFETATGKLVLLALAFLAFLWYIVYPLWLPIKWFLYGRDPHVAEGPVTAWYDPPNGPDGKPLTPAETGTLIDEKVDMRDISAMIVSLAQRGYFKIEEREEKDFYFVKTGNFGSADLRTFEAAFVGGMFGGAEEIRLKDEEMVSIVDTATKAIYKRLLDFKYFPENPQTIRAFYNVIIGIATFTFNLPLLLMATIFGRSMPRKTVEGKQAANVAQSLKNFLKTQERQLEFQAKNQMMFEKLLPFAVAFGVEKQWADRFKDIAMHQPDWYQSYGNEPFTSYTLTNGLHSSFNDFKSAATPVSSSSGFSSGFSGGSSGGGGGGGGGGSW